MSDYLHGAYGKIQTAGNRVADNSQGAIVYVGTAPVHTIAGGADNVNVPVLVNNIAEAKKLFGYSDDWAKYSLCEAMYVHLEKKGVGPLVLINVLDPDTHKAGTRTTVQKTPSGGMITIPNAEGIILDSITVATTGQDPVTKEKGTDYEVSYLDAKKSIVISELTSGALGTDALAVSYYEIDAAAVTVSNVIGSSDGSGLNTGIHAVKNVYQLTGAVPAFLACPGFSGTPAVHAAMLECADKINGHWDAYLFVDLPIVDGSTQITLDSARTWKSTNGYNKPNETVYFPMAKGVDGKVYHLSVLAAANFQEQLLENDGIPWKTASNTACDLIENLWLGENYTGRVFDDSIINAKLNRYGIASAVFLGGRWAIWGAHSAEYDPDNGDQINVAETNRMMLYYISNDFQARRASEVDKPMTPNDLRTIIAEEQTRLDALMKIGALIHGEVSSNASPDANSDLLLGDFSFAFSVTVTPLARSLTAIVNWTDDGFVTWFESMSV